MILVQMKQVPFGHLLLALSLIAMFFGSVGLVSGFQTRFSALVLAVCTAAWIGVAHDFWTIQNPLVQAADYQIFALGIAIIGGLLSFVALGAGGISIDEMTNEGAT